MREILLIRHAAAESAEAAASAGRSEAQRELTPEGVARGRQAFAGLAARCAAPEAIYASPLVRAQQTAELLASAFGTISSQPIEWLAPGASAAELGHWLAETCSERRVALVGHEPGTGLFVGWSLCGEARQVMKVNKAAAIMIRFDRVQAGAGQLIFAVPPAFLMSTAGL